MIELSSDVASSTGAQSVPRQAGRLQFTIILGQRTVAAPEGPTVIVFDSVG